MGMSKSIPQCIILEFSGTHSQGLAIDFDNSGNFFLKLRCGILFLTCPYANNLGDTNVCIEEVKGAAQSPNMS